MTETGPLAHEAKPTGAGSGTWRIDDLAQRAGLTVDTIRYYQREGLLPPPERSGRTNLYGAEHLDRLERIRELQGHRFSLAACKALLSEGKESLIEGIFGDAGGRRYELEELIERSGIDPELAAELRSSGLLRDPLEVGRDSYDADDLELLRTMAEMHRLGLPRKALVEIGRIYAEGIEATQREIIELFSTGGTTLTWTDDELREFQDAASDAATQIFPLARRLVDYTHHRTIQRLALGAIERGTIVVPDETA